MEKVNKDSRDDYYSKGYYLGSCEGHETWNRTLGTEVGILHSRLLEMAELKSGMTVLDFGCGRGEVAVQAALRGCPVVAMDASADAISLLCNALEQPLLKDPGISARITPLVSKFQEARFTENQFDVIFMGDVIEHLYDPELLEAFASCHRWLKPGGKLVVHTMPTREFLRVGQYIKWIGYALLGRKGYLTTFENERQNTHVNLQTRAHLSHLLSKSFKQFSVKYDFSFEGGTLKSLLRATGLHRWLAHNLWAIAQK